MSSGEPVTYIGHIPMRQIRKCLPDMMIGGKWNTSHGLIGKLFSCIQMMVHQGLGPQFKTVDQRQILVTGRSIYSIHIFLAQCWNTQEWKRLGLFTQAMCVIQLQLTWEMRIVLQTFSEQGQISYNSYFSWCWLHDRKAHEVAAALKRCKIGIYTVQETRWSSEKSQDIADR